MGQYVLYYACRKGARAATARGRRARWPHLPTITSSARLPAGQSQQRHPIASTTDCHTIACTTEGNNPPWSPNKYGHLPTWSTVGRWTVQPTSTRLSISTTDYTTDATPQQARPTTLYHKTGQRASASRRPLKMPIVPHEQDGCKAVVVDGMAVADAMHHIGWMQDRGTPPWPRVDCY